LSIEPPPHGGTLPNRRWIRYRRRSVRSPDAVLTARWSFRVS
jgi:hypothetical protein